ncbi:hypothetical protein TorRG33x02_055260, partial [Trema orientale]
PTSCSVAALLGTASASSCFNAYPLLLHLGFQCHPLHGREAWHYGRHEAANIQERIDRVVISTAWKDLFSDSWSNIWISGVHTIGLFACF